MCWCGEGRYNELSMNAIDDGQNYLILRTVPRTKLTKNQQEDISVKCKPPAYRQKYGLHGGRGGRIVPK